MVGELFTISAINIARSAVCEVEKWLQPQTPVNIEIDSRDQKGSSSPYVRVSSPTGPTIEIDIDDSALRSCFKRESPGAGLRMAGDMVDHFSGEIRAAVRWVLGHAADFESAKRESITPGEASMLSRSISEEALSAGWAAVNDLVVQWDHERREVEPKGSGGR